MHRERQRQTESVSGALVLEIAPQTATHKTLDRCFRKQHCDGSLSVPAREKISIKKHIESRFVILFGSVCVGQSNG